MPASHLSRRSLLEAAVVLPSPAVLAAAQHAHQAAQSGKPARFQSLSSQEASEIEAIAAQIIPTDSTPGAREAGVIYFIDRALATFDRDLRPAYRDGLRMFQEKRRELFPGASSIAGLTPPDQIRLIEAIEKTPFFQTIRRHTVMGFFGNPEYGGNRGKAGWALIGFEMHR